MLSCLENIVLCYCVMGSREPQGSGRRWFLASFINKEPASGDRQAVGFNMKKHYLALLMSGLLFSGAASAQSPMRQMYSDMKKGHMCSLELRAARATSADSIVYLWNAGTELESKWKAVRKYTPEGWLQEYQQLTWDNETSDWVLDLAESYTRDENGRKIAYEVDYSWGRRVEETFTWEGNKGIGEQMICDDDGSDPQYKGIVVEIDEDGNILKTSYSDGKKEDKDDANWSFDAVYSYEYDEQGRQTKSERVQYNDADKSKATSSMTTTTVYDDNGMEITDVSEDFKAGTTTTTVTRYEKKEGNPVIWSSYGDDGKLSSAEYHYYPQSGETSGSSFVEAANNAPVESKNGSFDLAFDLSSASATGVSFAVGMPEGFELDVENTDLSAGAGQYELAVAGQEGNRWAFDVKASSLRAESGDASAALSVHVVYTVDEALKEGSYDVDVDELRLFTPAGNVIYGGEGMTVPVVIERSATATEDIQVSEVRVSCKGEAWTIDSPASEMISIYTIAGAKVYQGVKPAGKVTLTLPGLPAGVMIVKGGSNWVEKVQIR